MNNSQQPSGGPENRRRRISIEEAIVVRRWFAGLAGAAILTAILSPYLTPAVDRAINIIVVATLATGAIQTKRPFGLRMILAGAAIGGLVTLVAPIASAF